MKAEPTSETTAGSSLKVRDRDRVGGLGQLDVQHRRQVHVDARSLEEVAGVLAFRARDVGAGLAHLRRREVRGAVGELLHVAALLVDHHQQLGVVALGRGLLQLGDLRGQGLLVLGAPTNTPPSCPLRTRLSSSRSGPDLPSLPMIVWPASFFSGSGSSSSSPPPPKMAFATTTRTRPPRPRRPRQASPGACAPWPAGRGGGCGGCPRQGPRRACTGRPRAGARPCPSPRARGRPGAPSGGACRF